MLKNGLINAVGTVSTIGLSLLTIPILIRIIGLHEYGLWTLVSAMLGVVGLAEGGLSVSTTVFLSRDLAGNDTEGISQTLTITLSAMLLLASFLAVVFWWQASPLVGLFPKLQVSERSSAIQALHIAGLVIWGRLLQQILVSVHQACGRYAMINILSTLQAALSSLGLIVVAWFGGHVVEMMQWQMVITLVTLAVLLCTAWRLLSPMSIHPSWNTTKGRELARYSGMSWLVSISGALFSQVDRLIVGAVLGTSDLGMYGAITSIAAKINILSAAPVQPLLPEISTVLGKPDIAQGAVREHVELSLRLNALVALGSGGVLLLLTPLLMRVIVAGAVIPEHILAFQVAMVIYALYSLNAVGFYILLADAVGLCMTIQLTSAALSLLMIAIGGTVFGVLGSVGGNAGYLGVSLLTIFGMRHLAIPVRLWVTWLRFPVVWFVMVIALNIMLPANIIPRMIAGFLTLSALLIWFVVVQIVGHRSSWQATHDATAG